MTFEIGHRRGGGFSRALLPVVILGIAILFTVVLISTRDKPAPVEAQEKAWLVSAQAVEIGSYSPVLTLYGNIESLWSSTLTAGIAADVVDVNVIAGDSVKRGDILVQLDDRDAVLLLQQREAEVEQASASIQSEKVRYAADLKSLPREQELLALAQNEVDRLQGLVERKVTSQSTLDTARQSVERQAISLNKTQQSVNDHKARLMSLQASLLKAESQRDKAALELERATVRAPFDGRISKLQISPGVRVRVGDQLVEIFDTSAMIFRALIPDQYVPRINAAKRNGHDLVVDGEIDGQRITARLRSVSAQVARGSGGVEGLFEIQGDGFVLQQGRLSEIQLTLPEQSGVISVPPESVYGTRT
ncbi:MAG: efflux RND transporter periplasmic adaptor subunit, partial [bacterium]